MKFLVEDHIYWAPASTTSDLYSQLATKKYWERPREQLRYTSARSPLDHNIIQEVIDYTYITCFRMIEKLGSGEFGNVYI